MLRAPQSNPGRIGTWHTMRHPAILTRTDHGTSRRHRKAADVSPDTRAADAVREVRASVLSDLVRPGPA